MLSKLFVFVTQQNYLDLIEVSGSGTCIDAYMGLLHDDFELLSRFTGYHMDAIAHSLSAV